MKMDFICPNEHECSEHEIDFESGLDRCPICRKPIRDMGLLSKAAMRVLTQMQDAEDADDLDSAEIVVEGRACYVGLDLISKATVNELLRLCLIRDDSGQNGKIERYSLNEEGRAMVKDPHYRPKILAHL